METLNSDSQRGSQSYSNHSNVHRITTNVNTWNVTSDNVHGELYTSVCSRQIDSDCFNGEPYHTVVICSQSPHCFLVPCDIYSKPHHCGYTVGLLFSRVKVYLMTCDYLYKPHHCGYAVGLLFNRVKCTSWHANTLSLHLVCCPIE